MGATTARPREIQIVVENSGGAAVRLRPNVAIELQRNGRWESIPARRVLLRSTCAAAAPQECVEVRPGRSTFAPWLGLAGDGQCECDKCYPADAGQYRFVVTSCEGTRIDGEPFALPAA